MSVYVDSIIEWGSDAGSTAQARRVSARTGGRWCHMFADTEAELDALATKIGLKLAWKQRGRLLHYDLTPGKRAAAIKAGAVEADHDTMRRFFVLSPPRSADG